MRKLLATYILAISGAISTAYSMWEGPWELARWILILALTFWILITVIYKWRRKTFKLFSLAFPANFQDRMIYAHLSLISLIFIILTAIAAFSGKDKPAEPDSEMLLKEWEAQRAKKDSLVHFTHGLKIGDTTIYKATKMQLDAFYLQQLVADKLGTVVLQARIQNGDTLNINSCQEFQRLKTFNMVELIGKGAHFRKEILGIHCAIISLGKQRREAPKSHFKSQKLFDTALWPIEFLSSINPRYRQKIDEGILKKWSFEDWINQGELGIQNINDRGVIFNFGKEQIFFTEVMKGDFNSDSLEDIVFLRTSSVQQGSARDFELLLISRFEADGMYANLNYAF